MLKKLFSLFTKKKSSLEKEDKKTVSVSEEESSEPSPVTQSEMDATSTHKEGEVPLSPEESYAQMEWTFLGLNPESGYIFQNISAGKRVCLVNETAYIATVDAYTATEIADRFNDDPNENAKKFIPEIFFCLCKKAEDDQAFAVKKAVEEKELEMASRIQKMKRELEEQIASQNSSDDFVKRNYPSIAQDERSEQIEQDHYITDEDRMRIQKHREMLNTEIDSQRKTLCGLNFYHKEIKIPFTLTQAFSQEQMEEFNIQKKDFLSRMFVTNTIPLEMASLQNAFTIFFESFYFVGFKRFEARLKQIPEIVVGEGDTYTGSYKVFLGCLASVTIFAECIKALPKIKASPEKFFGYEDFKKGNRTILEIFSTQVEDVISIEDIHLLEKLFEGSRFCANIYSETVSLIENNDERVEGKNLFSYFNKERISEQLFNGLRLL